jgi:hypothetical protein
VLRPGGKMGVWTLCGCRQNACQPQVGQQGQKDRPAGCGGPALRL